MRRLNALDDHWTSIVSRLGIQIDIRVSTPVRVCISVRAANPVWECIVDRVVERIVARIDENECRR